MKLQGKYPCLPFHQIAPANPTLYRNSGAATAEDTTNKAGSYFQGTSSLIDERDR